MSGSVLAVAAALALAPRAVAAQEPRVRAELDTALVSVGDRLTLTVTVEHAPGAMVVWPDSLDLAPFEVLGAQLAPPTTRPDPERGTVTSTLRVALTAFELGDLVLPSFEVAVVDGDDTTALATDAWAVTVSSVGLDEGGGIREIKGPLAIARSVVVVGLWALLALALLAAGAWLWRRRSRGEDEPTRLGVDIPRAPHVLAYEALDRLAASGMLERGEVEAFHVAVSEIVRTYVEGRFGVWAMEMTTGEVVASLKDVGVLTPLLLDLRDFLGRCDLVKFAKLRPLPEDSAPLLDSARAIVDRTRPRVERGPDAPREAAREAADATPADSNGDGLTHAGEAGPADDPGVIPLPTTRGDA
ncbi:MAG TPA: hypothetical protein VGA70_13615 [Longimicrobiales bacterium]